MESAVETILSELLDAIGISHSGITKKEIAGQVVFSVTIRDETRQSLVFFGDTVHALDILVKKIYEKRYPTPEGGEAPLFLIDINEYQIKRIKDLQAKAMMMAERARSFQYDVELTPMSAYERLIIHTTLQDAPHVKTESQGEGRNRRVVIKYAADA